MAKKKTDIPNTMTDTRSRDKLIEAIAYFVSETEYCGKLKLFKLLYLLDYNHYKATGRTVTGLSYEAWEKGPVPKSLWQEWGHPKPDFSNAVRIEPEVVGSHSRELVVPRRPPRKDALTRRELRLLEDISAEYKFSRTEEMKEATHEKGGPWDVVYKDGAGKNEPIPDTLFLRSANDGLNAYLLEQNEFLRSLRHG